MRRMFPVRHQAFTVVTALLLVAIYAEAVPPQGISGARFVAAMVTPPAQRFSCGTLSLGVGSFLNLGAPGTPIGTNATVGAIASVRTNCTLQNFTCQRLDGSSTPTTELRVTVPGGTSPQVTGINCQIAGGVCTSAATYVTSGLTFLYCWSFGATATATGLTCSWDCI